MKSVSLALDTTIIFNDVLIGEVWLASGQSNMEMPITGYLPNENIDNDLEEIAAADYPEIRMFSCEKRFRFGQAERNDGLMGSMFT